jgi:hypothetical protein
MTQVYISGPITGLPDLNRAAFDHEERLLREVGYETFNPHSITPPSDEVLQEWAHTQKDHGKENLWRHYMRICVGQIPLCDSMRMLPDWQNSKGAVWEHRIAMMLGLEVTYCPVVEVPKW